MRETRVESEFVEAPPRAFGVSEDGEEERAQEFCILYGIYRWGPLVGELEHGVKEEMLTEA